MAQPGVAPDPYESQFQQIRDMIAAQNAQVQNTMNRYNQLSQSLSGGNMSPIADIYQTTSGPTGPDGKPIAKQFVSTIDPTTGLLKDPYQLKAPVDTRGLEALRGEALRTGPSAWRMMEEASQKDALARSSAGQLAQARNQMAMQGGLRGGSAERLAAQGMNQNLAGNQGIARNLAIADEQKRMQAVGQLPGAELAQAGFNRDTSKYNIDKPLAEIFQKRASDVNQYNEQMRAWASEKTAAATPSGGGGGKK